MVCLGATLAVIIDMDHRTSVIFSACVAVFYTLFGGLYSVAYTDVIQLFCIFIGLWMCIPFAWANEHVKPLSSMEVDWIGEVDPDYYWYYIDYGLLLVFGGIPWQVIHIYLKNDFQLIHSVVNYLTVFVTLVTLTFSEIP